MSRGAAAAEMAVKTRAEVAEILGISPKAVREAERRALKKLRAALDSRPAPQTQTAPTR